MPSLFSLLYRFSGKIRVFIETRVLPLPSKLCAQAQGKTADSWGAACQQGDLRDVPRGTPLREAASDERTNSSLLTLELRFDCVP